MVNPLYKSSSAPSLISRDASAAIKGLLMLLVILGHTSLLAKNLNTGEWLFYRQWLYTFHVHIFFILPFIYGYKSKNSEKLFQKRREIYIIIEDVKHNIIKIGVPYCFFFIINVLLFVTIGKGHFDLKGVLYAFVFGNQPLMDEYVGFNFLWFLSAMLALSILKSIWYNSNRKIRFCLIVVSALLWLIVFFRISSQDDIGMYVPFSFSQAFFYLLLGIISRDIIENNKIKIKLPWLIVLIGVVSFLFFVRDSVKFVNFSILARFLLPILLFLILYEFRENLSKSRFLKLVGNYSLQVYLVHIYIINLFDLVLLHYFSKSILLGVIVYLLTVCISLAIAVIINKIPFINRVLFPKG